MLINFYKINILLLATALSPDFLSYGMNHYKNKVFLANKISIVKKGKQSTLLSTSEEER